MIKAVSTQKVAELAAATRFTVAFVPVYPASVGDAIPLQRCVVARSSVTVSMSFVSLVLAYSPHIVATAFLG